MKSSADLRSSDRSPLKTATSNCCLIFLSVKETFLPCISSNGGF